MMYLIGPWEIGLMKHIPQISNIFHEIALKWIPPNLSGRKVFIILYNGLALCYPATNHYPSPQCEGHNGPKWPHASYIIINTKLFAFSNWCWFNLLTHWSLRDLGMILKIQFSVFFYSLASSDLPVIILCNECHWTLLVISQHWFR